MWHLTNYLLKLTLFGKLSENVPTSDIFTNKIKLFIAKFESGNNVGFFFYIFKLNGSGLGIKLLREFQWNLKENFYKIENFNDFWFN